MAKHPFGFWIVLGFALLAAACGGPLARVDAGTPQVAGIKPQVLVVTLTGKLGTVELARCTRALREAADPDHSVRFVVFRLQDAGSQGEDVDDIQSLLDRVRDSTVETITVVQGRVTSGAAYIAVCTDRLYVLGNTQFGEITQPEAKFDEILAADPEGSVAQRFTAMREALAGRLQHRKHKLRPEAEKLVLAMADPRTQLFEATVREGGFERTRLLDTDELTALQGSGATVIAPEKLSRPPVIGAQQAEDTGLSSGTLQNLEQLAEVLTVDRTAMAELVPDWAEHMVGWLELLQPFLLVAGFVLILFEVKTPGVGLPGVLGTIFLALAMFHSYLVGLAEVTEILVFFLGLAAIAVEIFLLPGTVIFGAVGFLCLVLALVLSQQSFVLPQNAIEEDILLHNLTNVTLLFVMVLVLGFATWRILPKVPWFNRVLLAAPPHPATAGGSRSGLGLANDALMALVGRTGTAATVLRPTGTMQIDGQPYDVVTEGEFVEAGTPVRVLYVQGNRVVVAADPAKRAGESGSVGIVLLLCIVGLALIVCEVLFVSFGLIAVLSGVSLLSAVFVAFQDSIPFGVTVLVVEAIAAPIVLTLAFKLLPKTPFGKALILDGPALSATSATEAELQPLLGRTGVTLSALRPAGFARIDGQKVDVVTRGEMLEGGVAVVVVEVAGNRVVVARH